MLQRLTEFTIWDIRLGKSSKRMHAIGEQQLKRTQSGSTCSSRSGRDRSGAAAEADASGARGAAAEAGAIGEQQLEAEANEEQQLIQKRIQSDQGAAAEADASGEQQLKRTQSGSKRTQTGSSS